MNNYTLDACGPVYITIGDGGNVEGPYRNFVDEKVPNSPTNATYCDASFARKPSAPTMAPAGCAPVTFQPANAATSVGGGMTGLAAAPSANASASASAAAAYYCQSSQPVWSAYRDPSFGFGSLSFASDSSATFSWFRNTDQTPGAAAAPVAADSATYTRYAGACPSGAAGAAPATTASPPPPLSPAAPQAAAAPPPANATAASSPPLPAAAPPQSPPPPASPPPPRKRPPPPKPSPPAAPPAAVPASPKPTMSPAARGAAAFFITLAVAIAVFGGAIVMYVRHTNAGAAALRARQGGGAGKDADFEGEGLLGK